jgi:hypothetical protein
LEVEKKRWLYKRGEYLHSTDSGSLVSFAHGYFTVTGLGIVDLEPD